MRTRFLNKMTNGEVEEYLDKNDIIFIPIGVIETHGTFPLDVELTTPTAFAVKMAEQADGLVLGDLPYFYCGASCCGRGSVKMSVSAGVDYLKEISYSLLNQGFRRQVYISFHGPAFLTAGTVVLDFFHETKVPIAYIDMSEALKVAIQKGLKIENYFEDINLLFYGAYEILQTKDELVIDPNAEVLENFQPDPASAGVESANIAFFEYTRKLAHPSGSIGFYFSEPADHCGNYGALRSVEERDRVCKLGAQKICEIVELLEIQKFVDQMKELDVWTNTTIQEKYGKHMPKNKFSPWLPPF